MIRFPLTMVFVLSCLLTIGQEDTNGPNIDPSQEFSATVSTDSILIGNYIELSYSLENIDGNFEGPKFENIEVLSGPNTSSSIQIINGDKTSTSTYSYYLKPKELGLTIIPPAYIVTGGKTLEAAPIELNIYPNPENIITEPEKKNQSSIFEFRNFNPFGTTPTPPKTPATQEKPKRKYKRI